MTNEELHFQMLSGIITEGKYKLKLQENIFKNLLDKLTGEKKEPVRPGEFDGLTDEQAQRIYDEIKRTVGKPDKNYFDSYDQDATSMMITSYLQTLRRLEDKYPNIKETEQIDESIVGGVNQYTGNIIAKNNIKSLLTKTFVSEANIPGLTVTNKAKSESGKVNKQAIKDMEKDLSDYDKESKKQPKDVQNPVKFNYTDDSEAEYHQEMEIMNGQEMIQYDRTPSEEYKKRAEEAIEGSSRMGNNPEWANVVIPGQGGDPTFGKKLVKAIKASEKKRSEATPTTKMFGDDWEVTKDNSHKAYAFENEKNNKGIIKESNKMKRLTFKKPFNGVHNALNLIPESYKVDNKVFEITDGNEAYKLRWEGSLNEGKAVVLTAADKTLVNEDVQKMFHLMGYKSENTLGNLKGTERLSEDKKFNDIWDKTKTMLTENMDEELHGDQDEIDVNHDGKISADDFKLLRKDEAMYEMDAMGGMDSQSPVNQRKIKDDMRSTLELDVNKMGTNEKIVFDSLIIKIGDFLAQAGNQSSGQFKTLMDRMVALVDKEMVDNQQAAPQGEPMGESGMYEGDMEEKDRFNEVFDLGPEEDYSVDDISEGMLSEGFKFSNLLATAKEIAKEILQGELTDEDKKDIMNATNQIGNPVDKLSKLSGGISKLTPGEETELVNQSSELSESEGFLSDTRKRLFARFSAFVGAPASLIASIMGMWAQGSGWADSPILSTVHDMTDAAFGIYGGPVATLGFLASLLYLGASLINFNYGKDN